MRFKRGWDFGDGRNFRILDLKDFRMKRFRKYALRQAQGDGTNLGMKEAPSRNVRSFFCAYLKVRRSYALTNCARLYWKSFFFDLFGQRKRLEGKAGGP